MLENLSPAPPDPILGLTEMWKNDPNPDKINLGVGIFKDENSQTPILASVKAAEKKLEQSETSKSYLPIPGKPEYGICVRKLLFGEGHALVDSGRAVTAHTPGGTGALRMGADFIKKHLPGSAIWMSDPTWANHKGVFGAADLEIKEYPYYNAETHVARFDEMMATLEQAPANDIVLLHVCCHNPTGVDLDEAQWKNVAQCAKRRGWIPFLDFAYQGFGRGLEQDRTGVAIMAEAGVDVLIASSFSKNFSLYNERVGALTLVLGDKERAAAAFSHLLKTIRVCYSNPAAHGGLIVLTILTDKELTRQWQEELKTMRNRITSMRSLLVSKLAEHGVEGDFSFIQKQQGMFSYSGLNKPQVEYLREKKSIYIVGSGRINVAGITPANVDYLAQAIGEALHAAS